MISWHDMHHHCSCTVTLKVLAPKTKGLVALGRKALTLPPGSFHIYLGCWRLEVMRKHAVSAHSFTFDSSHAKSPYSLSFYSVFKEKLKVKLIWRTYILCKTVWKWKYAKWWVRYCSNLCMPVRLLWCCEDKVLSIFHVALKRGQFNGVRKDLKMILIAGVDNYLNRKCQYKLTMELSKSIMDSVEQWTPGFPMKCLCFFLVEGVLRRKVHEIISSF